MSTLCVGLLHDAEPLRPEHLEDCKMQIEYIDMFAKRCLRHESREQQSKTLRMPAISLSNKCLQYTS